MTSAYTISQLEHGYGGDPVLKLGPCLINQGSVHALIGPNGTGKSTLLNLLAFLTMPDHGQISFCDEKVNVKLLPDLRKRVGYVQQNPYLFNLTVLENIQLGLKLRGVKKQLRQSRAMDIIEQFNLVALANKRAHELSGGEVQKVAIARILILEPDILILDEPFTFLDRDFSLILENIITKIREERAQTLIFSIHDYLRAQRLADHVWTLANKKLVVEAPVNIFHGTLHEEQGIFDTGKLKIVLPDDFEACEMIAIEAIHVVISRTDIHSSMRNTFEGCIKSIDQHDHNIVVNIEAGELFTATITSSAQDELQLQVNDIVWVSFKSTGIRAVR